MTVDPAGPRSLTTKTLDLLAAFDERHTRLTLSELARRTRLPLTTVHRIVGEATRWGALERFADGTYGVGLRLWEVATHAARAVPLREAALAQMEDLYEATHENVQLAVRQGLDVVYIERLTGRDAVPVRTRIGGRFALHASGVGVVLLAYAPSEVQDSVLGGPLRAWTTSTVTDPGTLRSHLAAVRRDGYAIRVRQVTTDAVAIAAPVRGADGNVVAALSIVAHADGEPAVSFLPALLAACRSISRTLGAPQAQRRRR